LSGSVPLHGFSHILIVTKRNFGLVYKSLPLLTLAFQLHSKELLQMSLQLLCGQFNGESIEYLYQKYAFTQKSIRFAFFFFFNLGFSYHTLSLTHSAFSFYMVLRVLMITITTRELEVL